MTILDEKNNSLYYHQYHSQKKNSTSQQTDNADNFNASLRLSGVDQSYDLA